MQREKMIGDFPAEIKVRKMSSRNSDLSRYLGDKIASFSCLSSFFMPVFLFFIEILKNRNIIKNEKGGIWYETRGAKTFA